MIKINLVPQELLDKERQQQRYIQLIFISVIFVVVVLGLSIFHLRTYQRVEVELAAVQKEYNDKWSDIGNKIKAKSDSVNAIQTRLGVITDLLKGRYVYPHFMVD